MPILAQESFVHADQSGWPTSSGGQTWTMPRGTGTYSIAGNEGVNSANSSFSVARIGSGTATNTELEVRCKPADTTHNIGTIARYVNTNNFYYGVLVGHPRIGKNVAGTFTTLGTDTTFSYSAGTFYWLRFNLVGSTLRLRVWQDGSSEPSTWNVTVTDASLASGGYGLGSDATGSTSFDSLTVTDATVTNTRTVLASAVLLVTSTRTISDTAALLTTSERTVTSTAALLVTSTRAVTASAAIIQTVSRTIPASAVLLSTGAKSVPTSAALIQTNSRIIGAIAALLETHTRSLVSTAALFTTNARATPSSAALIQTDTRTVPCTAALLGGSPPANAMVLVRSGGGNVVVPSGGGTVLVQSGQASILVNS